jgi:hypothetical protein
MYEGIIQIFFAVTGHWVGTVWCGVCVHVQAAFKDVDSRVLFFFVLPSGVLALSAKHLMLWTRGRQAYDPSHYRDVT